MSHQWPILTKKRIQKVLKTRERKKTEVICLETLPTKHTNTYTKTQTPINYTIIVMEIYTRNTLLQTPSSSPFSWAFWVFSLWSEFHHHQQETKTKAKQNTFIHHFFSFHIKTFTQHFFSLIFFYKI